MSFFSWLTRRRHDEDDLAAEIGAHLALAEKDYLADGADPQSARQAALKDFGNVLQARETARRVWVPAWVDVLRDQAMDIRYAVRSLAKNPGFSLTVIGVLTLGVGLNGAVFTMLKGMALSPIAGVAGSSGLVVVSGKTSTGRSVRVSYPDYEQLRDGASSFDGLFGSGVVNLTLGRGKGARTVFGELVTGNYFQALGVRAARGRTLLPSDEVAPGRHPVVVLSDGIWRRDFGADPGILGRTIEVNRYPLTVVGVADPAFHGTIVSYDVEVFVPVMMAPQLGLRGGPTPGALTVIDDRRAPLLFPHGYLRPGTGRATAQAEVEALWRRLSSDRPLSDAEVRLEVVPFWRSPTGAQTYLLPALSVLSVMGLLVLLIACVNIAGLILVRGVMRRGELAIRLALGATRGRVIRLLVVEALVLAAPGTIIGVTLAAHGVPVFVRYAEWLATPQRVFFNVDVDRVVLGYAALVGMMSAFVFGVVPALRGSRVSLMSVINEDASPRGSAQGRLRAGLVIAQVSISFLLLVGAGLVTRSLEAARQADSGFDPRHVAVVSLDADQNAYEEAQGRAFYERLLDAARTMPGVEAAAVSSTAPLNVIGTAAQRVAVDGYAKRRDEDLAFEVNTVSPQYFRTLRIPLLSGREFDDRDRAGAEPVVIVNSTFAHRFWGGAAQALGRRVRVAEREWRTVVGVARDLKYSRIDEKPRPYLYLPFLQSYRGDMLLQVRGSGPIEELVGRARACVQAADADLPIMSARPLEEVTGAALVFLNLTATMLFLFGVAGMALAAMGTYGLVSYLVTQSAHEIGIRMALGAAGLAVVRSFLHRGLRLGVVGAGIGLGLALAAGALLRGFLYGTSASDPLSFGRALLIVLGGVTVATIVPAWRASRTNPLRALRHN